MIKSHVLALNDALLVIFVCAQLGWSKFPFMFFIFSQLLSLLSRKWPLTITGLFLDMMGHKCVSINCIDHNKTQFREEI